MLSVCDNKILYDKQTFYTNKIGHERTGELDEELSINSKLSKLCLYSKINSGLTTDNAIYDIRNLFNENRETPTELDDENCVVCYSNLSNVTFYPCNHDNCCEECYLELNTKNCPYCRTEIITINRENEYTSDEFNLMIILSKIEIFN
jgi:hypothetical protein